MDEMHTENRVVAIIECRMTSTRLPGKVLMESCGKSMLEHIVERLSRIDRLDQIVLATTSNETDDCIEALSERINVGCFRGSEEDVLKRVLGAAEMYSADTIVEITGDCPLIDPNVTSETILFYLENDCDYASNDLRPTYPLGMNVEVFSRKILTVADREGLTPADREHVSWFFVRNPERFRVDYIKAPPELHWPDLRLTLDEMDDFRLIDHLFTHFYPIKPDFLLSDIISYLKENPEVADTNSHVVQKNPADE